MDTGFCLRERRVNARQFTSVTRRRQQTTLTQSVSRARTREEGPPHMAERRPRKPKPPSVADRVKHIRDMMKVGEWPIRSRVIKAELAVLWGVSEATVGNYAAEAHHFFEADPDERERAAEIGAAVFAEARRRGFADGSPSGIRVAIEAQERLLKMLGVDIEPDRPTFAESRQRRVIKVVYGDDTPKADDDGSAGRQPPKQDPGGDA